MHELYHIIGICPDSIGHLDLVDILVANYTGFVELLKYLKNICF